VGQGGEARLERRASRCVARGKAWGLESPRPAASHRRRTRHPKKGPRGTSPSSPS